MCNLFLEIPRIEKENGIDFASYFATSLRELDAGPVGHGFVRRSPRSIEVTEAGRLFVRNVCMAFDAYLPQQEGGEKQVFSRTV
jgi:oxygen-independent coproporphyrinogen-3 oxidase